MKKIAHIVSTGEYSGAEKIVIEICKYLKNDYEFTYVCKKGEITTYLEEKGIKYIIYNSKRDLISLLRKNNFDIVHAHDYTASILSAFFAKSKIISHIHNNTPFAKTLNLKSYLYYIASYKVEKILCVSNTIINEMYFKNKMKNKLDVVYNWVNIEERQWREKSDKEIDLLFVGRFTEQKNPILFLEVIDDLKKNGFRNIKARMVGRGELKSDIIKYINNNYLNDNIEVLDFCKIPHKHMRESKIFFVPSKWEGFGLVFLEAIANECAVVTTPVGGIREIFKDNLENMANDKNEMIDKINLLLSDELYRFKYVENNKKILDRFDMKINIEKISEYYNFDELQGRIDESISDNIYANI